MCILVEPRWQVLKVVSQTQVDCHCACRRPMVLKERAIACHWEVHSRVAENLAKLVRIFRKEVREEPKR